MNSRPWDCWYSEYELALAHQVRLENMTERERIETLKLMDEEDENLPCLHKEVFPQIQLNAAHL